MSADRCTGLAAVLDATEAVVVLDTRVFGCLDVGRDHVRMGWCPTRAFVAGSRLCREVPVAPNVARLLVRRVIRTAVRVAVPSGVMSTTELHATLRWRMRYPNGPWQRGSLEFKSNDGWDEDAAEFYGPTRALVSLAERIVALYPLALGPGADVDRVKGATGGISGMNARSFRWVLARLRERDEEGVTEW